MAGGARHAVRFAAVLAACATLFAPLAPPPSPAPSFSIATANAADPALVAELPVREIAPGIFVHEGRLRNWGSDHNDDVANLGFIVGSRCVAVIDSGGSPAVGAALLAAVRRTTPLPVCYLINTHVHPDHVLGNSAFAALEPRPQFVGHARLQAALTARAPFYLAALERDFGIAADPALIVYLDRGVDAQLELDLGERRLQLRAWPTAHTDNDLSVLDEHSRTLFAGDLLFVSHLPVIDGKLKGWLQVGSALAEIAAAQVVPGHGASSADWPGALAPQTRYLNGVLDGVRAAIAEGRTMAQTIEALGAASTGNTAGWQLADEFHRRNLTAAYAELEWED